MRNRIAKKGEKKKKKKRKKEKKDRQKKRKETKETTKNENVSQVTMCIFVWHFCDICNGTPEWVYTNYEMLCKMKRPDTV